MLLVVDTGNTNTVMAVHDGDAWRGIWRISTHAERTSDEYWVWLQTMLVTSGIKPRDISQSKPFRVEPRGALPQPTLSARNQRLNPS